MGGANPSPPQEFRASQSGTKTATYPRQMVESKDNRSLSVTMPPVRSE